MAAAVGRRRTRGHWGQCLLTKASMKRDCEVVAWACSRRRDCKMV